MKSLLLFTLTLVMALLNSAAPVSAATPGESREPNVLLLIIDDQGYADLNPGPHGRSADVRTPHIDRLIESGAQFTNAYATSPICSPSRAGLITGRYQQRWGNTWYGRVGLPQEEATLAEVLKERGYATGYFGKVHYGPSIKGPESEMFPTRHGYDTFYGYLNHTIHYTKHKREYVEGQDGRMHDRFGKGPFWIGEEEHDVEGFSTELFGEAARQFISESRDRPFLATVSFSAVHNWVDQLPQDYVEKHGLHPLEEWTADQDYMEWYMDATHPDHPEGRRWYLAQLMYLDREIGRILDQLDELGLKEDTLIVYTSDNGGAPNTWSSNVPLAGYKFSLVEGGIRVPFILSWPGHIPAGRTYHAMVSGLDILPTAAAAAGVAPQAIEGVDGLNLLPLAQGNAPDRAHPRLFWDTGWEWAVREGDWKLRVVVDAEQATRTAEGNRVRIPHELQLYHLGEDIGERVNLASKHPEKVAELRRKYEAWRAEIR